MGDPKGYLKVKREGSEYRPVCERINDYQEVFKLRSDNRSQEQGSRCMDCGTPFCHWACPVGNYIPEWNDLMFRGRWEKALELLLASNNLPEITGRLCPAVCEYACVLGINDDPVTCRENELAIIEHGYRKGIVKPTPPRKRTGLHVAVVGSGPAGLTVADELNKRGHKVTVFERHKRPGGILRYGIPNFKLDKKVLDRRIDIWKKEGIIFKNGADVGRDIKSDDLLKKFDAVCIAGGSRIPRDLAIEGRDLDGIHFAMDYLIQSNLRAEGANIPAEDLIDAKDKRVVVIGGGDTGADCVGTANRQGASCVTQIEVLPLPPENRPCSQPWPKYPSLLKKTTSHEEGGERQWSITTKKFIGEEGTVKKLLCLKDGNEFEIDADLAILAIGFLHPEHNGPVKDLGLALDNKGNVLTDNTYMTSRPGVFAAGDMRRGQSLVVWAIAEGRQAAKSIDGFLKSY